MDQNSKRLFLFVNLEDHRTISPNKKEVPDDLKEIFECVTRENGFDLLYPIKGGDILEDTKELLDLASAVVIFCDCYGYICWQFLPFPVALIDWSPTDPDDPAKIALEKKAAIISSKNIESGLSNFLKTVKHIKG